MIGVVLAMSLSFSPHAAPVALQNAAQSPAPEIPATKIPATRSPAMSHATGTFDVQITPVAPEPDAPAGAPGRMRLAKTFHGGLEGTGAGEMLAVREGQSGAYVALERVTGTLDGRSGGFALVHRGVMDANGQDLLITIAPGSGSGDLTGIGGVFHLTVADGEHRYDLEYSLPEVLP
ncbi:DUF3224 domain-containing protein [Brevundimonas sp.]|jgi:hypothetical protein|uniref:DUF3224 domain-containing protein n=1 Tax=Brevundimonas sp. TaxID=1871086 RepID=UPI0037C14AF1